MLKSKIEKVIREAGAYVKNVDYSHVESHSKLNFRDICTEHDEKTQAFQSRKRKIPDCVWYVD